jgi:threonine-phosphate decarboxylase
MKQSPAPIFHGGQLRQTSERFAIPVAQLLDFSASINPMGPPDSVLTAIRLALESPGALVAIRTSKSLNSSAASPLPPMWMSTPSRSPMVLSHFSKPPCAPSRSAAASCRPMLRGVQARAPGCRRRRYSVSTQLRKGLRYDQDQLIAALKAAQHDSLFLANPQNPTSALCERASLIEILKAADQLNIHVLIDEASTMPSTTPSPTRSTIFRGSLSFGLRRNFMQSQVCGSRTLSEMKSRQDDFFASSRHDP